MSRIRIYRTGMADPRNGAQLHDDRETPSQWTTTKLLGGRVAKGSFFEPAASFILSRQKLRLVGVSTRSTFRAKYLHRPC